MKQITQCCSLFFATIERDPSRKYAHEPLRYNLGTEGLGKALSNLIHNYPMNSACLRPDHGALGQCVKDRNNTTRYCQDIPTLPAKRLRKSHG